MCQLNDRTQVKRTSGDTFITTYSLKTGINKFGKNGVEAAKSEMQQLHDRKCFIPIAKEELSALEKKRALESLIFLTEKRDGRIKARHCANGSTQRDYMSREEVASPTVSTEATLLTSTIDAEEERDVATCDIPNAFIQTYLDEFNGMNPNQPRTIMKIRGELVNILCEMDSIYKQYVVNEGSSKVLYVHVLKAIYGLLVSAMRFYKKLSSDLKRKGYTINPYDPCVANKMINGKQHTVTWHVDDLKLSHVDPQVNTDFLKWIKRQYGEIGEVKVCRGKVHDYLGMILDFTVPGQVTIDMRDYVRSMVAAFPELNTIQKRKVPAPWDENLFKVDETSLSLTKERENYNRPRIIFVQARKA